MIEVISSSHSFFCVTKLVFSRHILTYTKSRDNTLTERRKRTTDSFSPIICQIKRDKTFHLRNSKKLLMVFGNLVIF